MLSLHLARLRDMKGTESAEIHRLFASQYGLIRRSDLRCLGIDSRIERRRLATGEWVSVGRRVLRLAAHPTSPEQLLLAACLEAGPSAIASHQSAAWLWDLTDAPARPAITTRRVAGAKVTWADVHRPCDLPLHTLRRRGIPVTDPLRALVDMAGVVGPSALDAAIDAALARRLITAAGLMAELNRLGRRGRRGVAPMRKALRRRGIVGAPSPSVLESRFLRLLWQNGIQPIGVEVTVGPDGEYRLDTLISQTVAAEVDGFAYHHTPEQKARDEHRRNQLRLSGLFLLVYTWRDVQVDAQRVVSEIRQALALPETPQHLLGA